MDIKLSDEDNEVTLNGAGLPIRITGTATTERDKGASTVRFLIKGPDAIGKDPFDALSAWREEDNRGLYLHIGDSDPIAKCSLRECTLNLNASQLYVGVYTPFPPQEVRHWFE